MSNRYLSEKITKWLYTRDENQICPELVVRIFVNKFKRICNRFELSIAVSDEQMYTSMCEATCMSYMESLHSGKSLVGPHREFPYPSNWTSELEEVWYEYLRTHLCTYEFWEEFWSTIHLGPLESTVPMWRFNIQVVAPMYILRQTRVLYRKGLIGEEVKAESDEETYMEEAT